MTVPFWCVLIGALLPYVWVTIAAGERRAQFGSADNKLPRLQEANLKGRGARAMGAHNNAFEALPFFAAAVVIAHVCGADPTWSMYLAVLWVIARVAHGALYVADVDVARSLAFAVGMLCNVGLFVLAARAPAAVAAG
jgi:uncharacterized MAPEG superfamily protein